MGFVRKNLGIDISGGGAARAAERGAQAQVAAGERALETVRADLAPFRDIGGEATDLLMQHMMQPRGEAVQDVLNDPFFQQLAREQEQGTLAQRAALGLGGSGGTQDALQRNLLGLGEQFRQNRFNQLFNIASLGQASAAQGANQSANLMTQIGNVQSAGMQARPMQQAAAGQQLLQLGGMLGGAALGGAFGGVGGGMLGGMAGGSVGSALGPVGAGATAGMQGALGAMPSAWMG